MPADASIVIGVLAAVGAVLAGMIGVTWYRKALDGIDRLSDETVQLASMIYRYSDEAMMVTDGDNRIIAINPAFTRLTGYSELEVIGRNPRMLSSGRQDRQFYQQMWASLNATGTWQGQIINRRKNGDEYVERLTLNAIFNADRQIYRYVALFSDITEKMQFDELIWKQANFDTLTGLPNRRMAREKLEHEIRSVKRGMASVALLLIDIDQFKLINDTLGHGAGDTLLVEASRRLAACVREWDIVARSGGDEFTVILPGLAGACRPEPVAQAILAALSAPYMLGDDSFYTTVSIGIALYPADADDAELLLRNANQAIDEAKKAGRNRYCRFTPDMQEATQNRLKLVSELHQAVSAGQFDVHFQPIIDLATGNIRKAEALLRWVHPERGMVSPASFIPVAEETGLILPIGDWAMREAAAWAARWNQLCPEGFQVSVNVSPVQFHGDGDLAARWLRVCEEQRLPPSSLIIEITESLLLEDDPEVAVRLSALRQAGARIAIDDFGTGYSALSYIKRFEVDYLKIDRSFIHELEADLKDRALVEAIIAMSHKLGLKVVAEGVESAGQSTLLNDAGCNLGQGYLYSRPLPAQAFETFLLAHLEQTAGGRAREDKSPRMAGSAAIPALQEV